MPTTVGILTLIRRINTTSESFNAKNNSILQHFQCYELLKSHTELSGVLKKVL